MFYMITDPTDDADRAYGTLFDDVEDALDEGHAITHEVAGFHGLYFVDWLPDDVDLYELDDDELATLEHKVAARIRRTTAPVAACRAYERAYNRRAV